MRIFSSLFRRLCSCAPFLALPFFCAAAATPDNVVLQYHFIGATQLDQSTNVAAAKKIFTLRPTDGYKNLVLTRMTTNLAGTLRLATDDKTISSLRQLIDSLLLSESFASVGGSPGKPLEFVLAVHLDSAGSQTWQQNLKSAFGSGLTDFQAEGNSGSQWKKGTDQSFWMVPAKDWLVLGTGESLAPVRSGYLQQIQQSGHPDSASNFNCFDADVDWPRLTNWISLSFCPLKLARTQMTISASPIGFHMTGKLIYPEEIQWQPHPMILPTNLVDDPLVSFVTGQNVEPFLKSDETLSQLPTNPFSDQFYFWSLRDLAFQSYAVWPVTDPSNTMMSLSAQAIDELNPSVENLDHTEITWMPKSSQLMWNKLQLVAPSVRAVPPKYGSFLMASLFPYMPGKKPVPEGLWQQITGRPDLVYYDWEFTGPRVRQLLTVTQVLPVLQMFGMGGPQAITRGDKSPEVLGLETRLGMQERWLISLAPFLGKTITEVTKTGPRELSVVRNSPFVLNSFELVLLSHWLTGTPASPIDWRLLPQAKMSGPGVPTH